MLVCDFFQHPQSQIIPCILYEFFIVILMKVRGWSKVQSSACEWALEYRVRTPTSFALHAKFWTRISRATWHSYLFIWYCMNFNLKCNSNGAAIDLHCKFYEFDNKQVSFCAVDGEGNACSFINSNYMGFGSGLVYAHCDVNHLMNFV
jgi:hypothetical protein